MKRIAIVGSRPPREASPASHHALFRTIRADVTAYVHSLSIETVVVSGDASGVDQAAWEAAWTRGMLIIQCSIPQMAWKMAGNGIAIVRNRLIVACADELMAFRLDGSKGTGHAIDLARAAGKPVTVHEYWTTPRPEENR